MGKMGGELSPAIKKKLVKIALSLLGIFGALSMPLIASLAWFQSNQHVQQTDSGLRVTTDAFDIVVPRNAEARYDSSFEDSEHNPFYPWIDDLIAQMESEGYSFDLEDSAESPSIAIELTNEYHDSEDNYSLLPGAYGTLTFYVRPHSDSGSELEINVSVGGYKRYYNDDASQYVIQRVTEQSVLDILKGHILLFTGRTGAEHANYQYSGLITDGSFLYELEETYEETDTYEVVLYWEWPITYNDIYLNISTTSPAVTKKYPAELADYLLAHPEYFFGSHIDAIDDELVMNNNLIDGYNDGDQIIGDNVHFIVIDLS